MRARIVSHDGYALGYCTGRLPKVPEAELAEEGAVCRTEVVQKVAPTVTPRLA